MNEVVRQQAGEQHCRLLRLAGGLDDDAEFLLLVADRPCLYAVTAIDEDVGRDLRQIFRIEMDQRDFSGAEPARSFELDAPGPRLSGVNETAVANAGNAGVPEKNCVFSMTRMPSG